MKVLNVFTCSEVLKIQILENFINGKYVLTKQDVL